MEHDARTLRVVDAFEQCTLASLSHEDHVRVAWCYLTRDGLATVLQQFSARLKRYATSKGAPDLYHETITFAFVCLIHERVALGDTCSWDDFAACNSDLLSSLLEHYYERNLLESEDSRRVFLLPRGH